MQGFAKVAPCFDYLDDVDLPMELLSCELQSFLLPCLLAAETSLWETTSEPLIEVRVDSMVDIVGLVEVGRAWLDLTLRLLDPE